MLLNAEFNGNDTLQANWNDKRIRDDDAEFEHLFKTHFHKKKRPFMWTKMKRLISVVFVDSAPNFASACGLTSIKHPENHIK